MKFKFKTNYDAETAAICLNDPEGLDVVCSPEGEFLDVLGLDDHDQMRTSIIEVCKGCGGELCD